MADILESMKLDPQAPEAYTETAAKLLTIRGNLEDIRNRLAAVYNAEQDGLGVARENCENAYHELSIAINDMDEPFGFLHDEMIAYASIVERIVRRHKASAGSNGTSGDGTSGGGTSGGHSIGQIKGDAYDHQQNPHK